MTGGPAAPGRWRAGPAERPTTRVGRRRRPVDEPPATGSAAVDAEPDHEHVARTIALDMLTRSARSRAQLAQAMARRGVPDDVATRVLDRFTEVGLVDDEQYARMLVRTRHDERGLARAALRVELRRRGVDDETAALALTEVDDEDEEHAARALVRRKLAATAGLDSTVRTRRTLAALGRRGYPPGLVARLVREELHGDDTDEPGDLAGLRDPADVTGMTGCSASPEAGPDGLTD